MPKPGHAPPRRGRPSKGESNLTVDSVISAASMIVETRGLQALSMRALAASLGCTPRALYRHIEGKAGVLELLANSALTELTEMRSDLHWEDALEQFFVDFRAILVAHPAVALIIAQQTVAGPLFLHHANRTVGALVDAGFSSEVAVEAVASLAYYTLGASVPGAGQPLQDRWQRFDGTRELSSYPALEEAALHFVASKATSRFRNALRHMIRGYAHALRE